MTTYSLIVHVCNIEFISLLRNEGILWYTRFYRNVLTSKRCVLTTYSNSETRTRNSYCKSIGAWAKIEIIFANQVCETLGHCFIYIISSVIIVHIL